MTQYLISSPMYSGVCKALYINGTLAAFDYTECKMNHQQIKVFKEIIPVLESDLEAAFSTTKCMVVQSDYEVQFEDFWKQGLPKCNKIRAQKIWDKMNKTDQLQATIGVKPYVKGLNTTAPCHPDTYLTYKRWLDGK